MMLRLLGIALLAGFLLFLWIELILWLLNLRGTGDVLGGIIAIVLCDTFGALLVVAFRNVNTRRRERLIQREAELCLIERRAGRGRTCSLQHRILMIVPSAIALLFFLFEPETIGIYQHLLHRGTISVGTYRIAVPLTWVRYSVSNWDQPEEQWIMNAQGLARMGRHPYWAIGPLVLWDFGFSATAPLERHPLHARRFPEFLSRRNATVADQEITCDELQYLGTYYHEATIACSTTAHDLYIHFSSDTTRARAFDDFLQHNVWQDTH